MIKVKNMINRFAGKHSFLSNFYSCKICIDGITYPSAEHAFQAMKCLDREERVRISFLNTPQEAKKAGRRVDLRSDWEDVKVDIMKSIVQSKFSDPELLNKLLDTGIEEIVEGNTWGDTFWGVYKGQGENMLGKILMEVRDEARESYE